jgi:hypothetical protein
MMLLRNLNLLAVAARPRRRRGRQLARSIEGRPPYMLHWQAGEKPNGSKMKGGRRGRGRGARSSGRFSTLSALFSS